MKPGISAVIVVHNQVELLHKCLASIKGIADEIILIDLESTEDIKSIATSVKAKYVSHPKVAIVEELRQHSLQYASHEYVLFLDPDETIPESLAQDLKTRVAKGDSDYFVTPRQNYLLGKWVRHSRWWPDMQTRLFRQGKVNWGETLHAEPQVSGTGYTYESHEQWAIHHENYRTLDEYIEKNMRYAKADAQDRVTAKQPLSLAEATRLSVSEMMSRLFQDQGYKDGMHGLVLSILQSFYYFMVYAYYWETQKYAELETEATIKSFPRTWFSHGLAETLHWDKTKSPLKNIKAKLVRRMIA